MAKVSFKRIEDSANINEVPILDGQLIYTKDGKVYMDYEGERISIGQGGGGSGGDDIPTGVITQFGGSIAPDGWLICDGSAVSRATYADLFNAIGTTYGIGDGSTTFNLPNLKGKVPVGIDNTDENFYPLGMEGGEKAHTLTVSEIPSHTHKLPIAGTAGSTDYLIQSYTTASRVLIGETGATGGGQAHNILQPYIVLNYIIKY